MSQDSTKPKGWVDEAFVAVHEDDVRDERLVMGLLRTLQRETQAAFGLVMSALTRIEQRLETSATREEDFELRIRALEQPKRRARK